MDVKLHPEPKEPLDLSQLSVAKGLAYVTAFVENRAYREAKVTAEEKPKLDGFGLPIGVREKVSLQGAATGGRVGDGAVSA